MHKTETWITLAYREWLLAGFLTKEVPDIFLQFGQIVLCEKKKKSGCPLMIP